MEETGLTKPHSTNDDEGHDSIARGTVWGTTFNTLTCVMGGGVLSLSNAFYNSSIGLGMIMSILFAFIGAFAVYCICKGADASQLFTMNKIVAHALYPSISPEAYNMHRTEAQEIEFHVAEHRLKRRRLLVNALIEVVIFFLNFGCLIVYGRVIADSIPPVVEDFLGGSGVATNSHFWLIIAGVAFFFLTCARTMHELKWSSILGFVTIAYISVLVIIRSFLRVDYPLTPAERLKVEDVRWFEVDVSLFKTFGNLALAFGYHFNVPLFYRELAHRSPRKMMSTVALAYPVITFAYVMTGLCGYVTFGALVHDKAAGGNIVNNYSKDDIAVNIGRLGLFFHFCCVYPLLSVCARQIFHRTVVEVHRALFASDVEIDKTAFGDDPRDADLVYTTPLYVIVIEAFVIVGLSILLAAVVPGIGIVIEVVGVLFGLLVMLVFPGIIGLRLWNPWNSHPASSPHSTFDFGPPKMPLFIASTAVAVLGVILMFVGIYAIFGTA